MDRMEEYKALRDAPEELPPALEGAVARARRCLPPSCSW